MLLSASGLDFKANLYTHAGFEDSRAGFTGCFHVVIVAGWYKGCLQGFAFLV